MNSNSFLEKGGQKSPRPGKWRRVGAALFCAASLGRVTTAPAAQQMTVTSINLGMVSETHRRDVEKQFREFAQSIARRYSGDDADGKVVIASTAFELAKLLDQRKIDFYMESPYPTYVINYVHGAAKLLVRRWKNGQADYQSLIFTAKASGITQLEDLRGKTIAFEDPESTSGYLLAKFFLLKRGFKLSDRSRFEPHGAPSEIGYLFAHSQKQLVDWVATRRVAAAAFSDADYAGLTDKQKAEISILAKTDRLPRSFVSVRKDWPATSSRRLENILVNLHEDPEGRKILQQIDATTKFDRLLGGEAAMQRKLADSFGAGNSK